VPEGSRIQQARERADGALSGSDPAALARAARTAVRRALKDSPELAKIVEETSGGILNGKAKDYNTVISRMTHTTLDNLKRETHRELDLLRHEHDGRNKQFAELKTSLSGYIDTVLKGIEERMVKKIIVTIPEQKPLEVENPHMKFERLVRAATRRHPVLLSGPAGSGKGTGGWMLAQALKLAFYSKSCSPMDTISQWMGFIDGHGIYRRTPLRDAFEHGGVFLIDEIDASNPVITVALNELLAIPAGRTIAFPDGMVAKHPDFIAIAAANTWGMGADRQYVGRNQLDAATLDRFAKIAWDYDEELELKISPIEEWTRYVQRVRRKMFETGIRQVVSPRASIMGGEALTAGDEWPQVQEEYLFANWSKDERMKVSGV
jgi:hypothetical protein